ncbi:hypothetical protein D6829_00690 [Candidatus Pacearchaeota archaeon]|nr:MAG: hypothetical protein D6829_00690 [Candidatus Pacearchaeota archaeon]
MEQEELLDSLKKEFEKTKKRLGFSATYEEIENYFFIEDMVLSQKAVSRRFSRQMANWIIEGINSWISQLYSWVYPAPTDAIHLHESKSIKKEEREEIIKIIDYLMYFTRKNKKIAFCMGKEQDRMEGEFIDEVLDFYRGKFLKFIKKYLSKFENFWKEEINEKSDV